MRMTRKGIITKPSENKSTESRRAQRVKNLLLVGWSVEKIRQEMNLTAKMVNHYYELSLDRKEYTKYRSEHDLTHKEVKGLEWGSKTDQYYPSGLYSEEDSWSIPDYQFSELSEEEKEFYETFDLEQDWERLKQEKSEELWKKLT